MKAFLFGWLGTELLIFTYKLGYNHGQCDLVWALNKRWSEKFKAVSPK